MFLLETTGDKAERQGEQRRRGGALPQCVLEASRAGQGPKGLHQTFPASHQPAWLSEKGGEEQDWKPGQLAAARRSTGLSPRVGAGEQGRGGKDLLPFGFGACCDSWALSADCQDPVSTCPAPCQSQPRASPSPVPVPALRTPLFALFSASHTQAQE